MTALGDADGESACGEAIDCSSLGQRPRSLHPALGALQRLSAALEELQMHQGKRIEQVLGAIALEDPQHQGQQIRANHTLGETSLPGGGGGVAAEIAQQRPQIGADFAGLQQLAQQRIGLLEELLAHGRQEMIATDQIDAALPAQVGNRLGATLGHVADGGECPRR